MAEAATKPAAKPTTEAEIPPAEIVEAADPKVGDDGKVYVQDAVSEAAVAQGYAPDAQARAHPSEKLKAPTDAELKAAEETKAANDAALEKLGAPLSVKVAEEAEAAS